MKKEAKSFKGWKFIEWLKGNEKTLKELIKVGVPLAIGWFATGNEILAGFITIVGKFLLDSLEYWVKEK